MRVVESRPGHGYTFGMRTHTFFPMMLVVLAPLWLAACATDGSDGVVDKVLTDFGIREPSADHVSNTDRVFARLDGVGRQEMRRLNVEGRQGEVLFQDGGGLTGQYYRQVKVYEAFQPLDAQRVSRGRAGVEYLAFVQYTYAIYQSDRFPTRVEATAAPADIRTGETGTEVYRYTLGPTGVWQGRRGELTRR